jgi:hypothetical protein
MKTKIPPIEELVNRLAKQIEYRHEGKVISENEKLFLIEKWTGKESALYITVKDMENKQVKFKNVKDRIDHRTVQFQCGVDFLGFPIYVIHEAVFQIDVDNKYPIAKNVSNQKFLRSRQYTIVQH